ncbi:MAG: hypothetical protein GF398_14350 [Chitinivibrionales bacterium]|nr:hypothetical protein [Chitinivibrionales bacterium]
MAAEKAPAPGKRIADSTRSQVATADTVWEDTASGDSLSLLKSRIRNAALRSYAQKQTDQDSLRTDSLHRREVYDSLISIKLGYRSLYTRFAQAVDSVHDPSTLALEELFRADGSGPSELLARQSRTLSMPRALVASVNRALYYGNVLFDGALYTFDSPTLLSREFAGSDQYALTELQSLSLVNAHGIEPRYHPLHIVSPETHFYWENGLFSENVFSLRFARPIWGPVRMGVFTNFRHLAGKTFSHGRGNIIDFYDELAPDTALMSRRGYNPLTDEMISGARFSYHNQNGLASHLAYHYTDKRNDLVDIVPRDNLDDSLGWARLTVYAHDLDAGIANLPLGNAAGLDGRIRANIDVYKESPLSRIPALRRGEENHFMLSLRPHLHLFAADTAWANYSWESSRRRLFSRDAWRSRLHRLGAGYISTLRGDYYALSTSARVEQNVARIDAHEAAEWGWLLNSHLSIGTQSFELFGARRAIPYSMPFDTARQITSQAFDLLHHAGGEAFLNYGPVGLIAGYQYMDDVDSATLNHNWQEGIFPYAQPNSTWLIAPVFGSWHGLRVSSRWFFSPTQPQVKSLTRLSYDIHTARQLEHISLDACLHYWSRRDDLTLGQSSEWRNWRREIWDISLKTAFQISTFRLFYKIDNLLNRKVAWIPGYYTPGLTFRWGFAWLIQG